MLPPWPTKRQCGRQQENIQDASREKACDQEYFCSGHKLRLTGPVLVLDHFECGVGLAISSPRLERSKGGFLVKSSPVQEMKPWGDAKVTVGVSSRGRMVIVPGGVIPGPQTVERIPRLGKDDPSGRLAPGLAVKLG